MGTSDRIAVGALVVSVISLAISAYLLLLQKRAQRTTEQAEAAQSRTREHDTARERDRQAPKRRADLRAEIMASTLFVRNFGESEATEITVSITCGDTVTDRVLFGDIRPPHRLAAGGAVSFHLRTWDRMPRRYDAKLTWKNPALGDGGLWESSLTREL